MDFFAEEETDKTIASLDAMNPMDMGAPHAPEASQAEEKMSFEEAMARLEKIVQRMESSETSLDESLDLFKEGSKLAAFCQKQLSDNENKIRQLLESEKGTHEEEFKPNL